jgi:hypothetical protein
MHWIKKATNPRDPHLRAGGFEVLPLAEIFELPWQCKCPPDLVKLKLVPDTLLSWAANACYLLGTFKEPEIYSLQQIIVLATAPTVNGGELIWGGCPCAPEAVLTC